MERAHARQQPAWLCVGAQRDLAAVLSAAPYEISRPVAVRGRAPPAPARQTRRVVLLRKDLGGANSVEETFENK